MGTLLERAANRIREDGVRGLSYSSGIFAYRHSLEPILTRLLYLNYIENVVDSKELRDHPQLSSVWELPEDLDGLSKKWCESVVPLQPNDDVEHYLSPHFWFKQPFLAEFSNATVLGSDATAFDRQGRVLADTMSFDPSNTVDLNPRIKRAIRKGFYEDPGKIGKALFLNKQPSAERELDVACILHETEIVYYHWLLEQLLKVRGLERYQHETGADVTCIIPPDPPSYVHESLDVLGIDESDRLEWDARPTRINRLIIPSFPELTPNSLEWLQDAVFSDIDLNQTKSKWIFISRQEAAKGRKIQNFDEIRTVLDAHNIETVQCEKLTFEEEVNLFHSAEGVISPHGGGLSAIVWGHDLEVIEIFNGVVQPSYNILAHVLGHSYTALSGRPVEREGDPRNYDLVLDPSRLDSVLTENQSETSTPGNR